MNLPKINGMPDVPVDMVIPDNVYIDMHVSTYWIKPDRATDQIWMEFAPAFLPFIKIRIPMDRISFAGFMARASAAANAFQETEPSPPAA